MVQRNFPINYKRFCHNTGLSLLLQRLVFALTLNVSYVLLSMTQFTDVVRWTAQGQTYRHIDSTTIEVTDMRSGIMRTRTLLEPSVQTIYDWADSLGIPVIEIQPDTIDTIRYRGFYNYWTRIPLSNGFSYPLVIGDANNNGKPEVYGGYKGLYSGFESRVYEINNDGTSTMMFNYIPRRGASIQLTDVDKNGLKEIVFQYGDSSFFYEQDSITGIPTTRKFAHSKFDEQGTAIGSKEKVINLDKDTLVDYLYLGSEWDSTHTFGTLKTCVAEFDYSMMNFKKVWTTQLGNRAESGVGGYDVGDYDNDGKMEFSASGLRGQVWIVENTGDNTYAQMWKDSVPLVNMFFQGSGDVDGDDKTELFVGASMSNGNWTVVYENDSDNHYSPTQVLYFNASWSMAEPRYLVFDVDNDSRSELVIGSGSVVYIFKSDGDNTYRLWYYHKMEVGLAMQFYDFNADSLQDLVISKVAISGENFEDYADIYLAGNIMDVSEQEKTPLPKNFQLHQNYPNPFNPTTVFGFELPAFSHTSLKIYTILGEEVATVVNEKLSPGKYTRRWNRTGVSSGMYFYRLTTEQYIATKKLLIIK